MTLDYFRDLNKYFGTLFGICKVWYQYRGTYTKKQSKMMFQILLKIEDNIIELKKLTDAQKIR